MSSEALKKLSTEEYLEIERRSEFKSEFWDGEMFAMAGASEAHNLVVLNIGAELRNQLKKRPCKAYLNDMRVRIPRSPSYKYPDVVIICGQPQFEDTQQDTLLNPTVIIEVLSPSTEAYDRGTKFKEYRKIESLQEYVLISQDKVWIERYVRQEDSPFWMFSDAGEPDASIELSSVACALSLAEVYDKVEFER